MSKLNSRISIFNEIRDLPFFIGTDETDDCCCISKSYMLNKRLEALGLNTRIVITTFSWEDTPVPQSVLIFPHPEIEEHATVEVFVPESQTWVDVDPTWDPSLYKIFKISEWDGIHSTPIGVPWIDRYDPEKSARIFAGLNSPEGFKDYLNEYRSFAVGMNKWTKEIRMSS